jgi:hypothetical protein
LSRTDKTFLLHGTGIQASCVAQYDEMHSNWKGLNRQQEELLIILLVFCILPDNAGIAPFSDYNRLSCEIKTFLLHGTGIKASCGAQG